MAGDLYLQSWVRWLIAGSHNKQRLHKVGYFRELLSANEEVQESIRPLLQLSRDTIVRIEGYNRSSWRHHT